MNLYFESPDRTPLNSRAQLRSLKLDQGIVGGIRHRVQWCHQESEHNMDHFLSQHCLDRWVKLQARLQSHDCSHLRQSVCSKANKSRRGSEAQISRWKPSVGVLRFTFVLNKHSRTSSTPLHGCELQTSPAFVFFPPSSVAIMEQFAQETGCCLPFDCGCVCGTLSVCAALFAELNALLLYLRPFFSPYFRRILFSL